VTIALLYHDVVALGERDAAGFPGPLAAPYKLTPEDFERHLAAIASRRVEVGLLDGGVPPAVALTFDDGGSSALDIASALERRGWRGHFFVTSGLVDTPGFLRAEGVRELRDRGHIVGSHSHTHPTYMGTLSADEILGEWTTSREVLGEILGEPPESASVPGGYLSRDVIDGAAAAGYSLLMTSDPTSRMRPRGRLMVLGRFAIRASTPPGRAARYATGARAARGRLWLGWQAKSAVKRVSPNAYEQLRRARRARRSRD
jgi:peptidoglycan/xylan/chitin deacetylase (PgdA/CDA1 family)